MAIGFEVDGSSGPAWPWRRCEQRQLRRTAALRAGQNGRARRAVVLVIPQPTTITCGRPSNMRFLILSRTSGTMRPPLGAWPAGPDQGGRLGRQADVPGRGDGPPRGGPSAASARICPEGRPEWSSTPARAVTRRTWNHRAKSTSARVADTPSPDTRQAARRTAQWRCGQARTASKPSVRTSQCPDQDLTRRVPPLGGGVGGRPLPCRRSGRRPSPGQSGRWPRGRRLGGSGQARWWGPAL
jgi:hypothetical protein